MPGMGRVPMLSVAGRVAGQRPIADVRSRMAAVHLSAVTHLGPMGGAGRPLPAGGDRLEIFLIEIRWVTSLLRAT